MLSFVVEFRNKRYNVRGAPVKPLQAVLEEACGKIKPKLDPAKFALIYNKHPVDLQTPVRLLNIPSGAKFSLQGKEDPQGESYSGSIGQRIGVSVESKPENTQKNLVESKNEARIDESGVGTGTGDSIQRGDEGGSVSGMTAEKDLDETEHGGKDSEGWNSLEGLDRRVSVFHHDDLSVSISGRDDDLPDEFFEFTSEDYHRVMQVHKKATEKSEMGLKTKTLREREERERAESLGPINIRFFFPDGMVCQSEFSATETTDKLYEFSAGLTVTGEFPGYVLYTAPPRVELENREETLYRAQLVPAANVHIGISRKKRKGKKFGALEDIVLKPEILKLRGSPPKIAVETNRDGGVGVEKVGERKAVGLQEKSEGKKEGGKKVPKWMKL